MYGRLEEADTLIESLCRDKDPLLRRSGMHTVAMAYCGTGNNKAIRKLLHVAVSRLCYYKVIGEFKIIEIKWPLKFYLKLETCFFFF